MPLEIREWLKCMRFLPCGLLLFAPAIARGAPGDDHMRSVAPTHSVSHASGIADSAWVDHDGQAIRRPPDWEPIYWAREFRQGIVDPVTHAFDLPDKLLWGARAFGAQTHREAVNVNAFDEAPNSSWFTNRNHMRAVPVAELRQGPDSVFLPAKPWIIKHRKKGGWTQGFQIKDADGKKWLVKLDTRGYLQLSSGADMVARTLLHAAGYNVPHNQAVRFQRGDVTIDPDLARGAEGERFTQADLDSTLAAGATFPDGTYSGYASLYLEGHVLGSPSMNRLRPGDTNDWYTHSNRRELRGLFALCSWIDNWDTKDQQFLDMFVDTRDSLGHVQHYLLDAGSSFGAAGDGPKLAWEGYENGIDFGWAARRFITLGFVEEPWRRARREIDLPSVGIFESEVYRPEDFRQLVPNPTFREMTDRDGYWGAKIVASFSDAQIGAAVDAAHYEDPRASAYLVRNLIARRDKVARYWFGRIAPLDFFTVRDAALRFSDLAVDVGLEAARGYDVECERSGGRVATDEHIHLSSAELPLTQFGTGASNLSFEISVSGNSAKSTRVELTRKDDKWIVTRVRHG